MLPTNLYHYFMTHTVLANVKDKYHRHDRQGAVYRIKCTDCQDTYTGETGRNLKPRQTEHKRTTRTVISGITFLNAID